MNILHQRFLHHAMSLAERGRGFVSPNPVVGAVLVRKGKIIAQDWHQRFGEDHAERNLLEKFKGKIIPSDVLYVTLEPCCHTDKKTPPCTEIIVDRGVKNVVVGMLDPNPAVSGKGVERLRQSGVMVTDLRDQLFHQNRFFFTWVTKHRPWVTLKIAQTLDGRIAPKPGMRLQLTGKKARQHMLLMRSEYDAILVGANTVIVDNPKLTARDQHGVLLSHQPRVVVLDSKLCIPLSSRVVRAGTIIFTAKGKHGIDMEKQAFIAQGAEVVGIDADKKGFLNLQQVLKNLAHRGISSLLVEGGPKVWSAFLRKNLVDEFMVYVAPMFLGSGVSPFHDLGFRSKNISFHEFKRLGNDLFWNGFF